MAKCSGKDGNKRSGAPKGVRRGRFDKGMDPEFAAFNASISFDKRLFAEDIAGSVAHVKMLRKQGILSSEDARAIEEGLGDVLAAIQAGSLEFRNDLEDVHINVEEALKERIGDVAGKLHTARSRNDQVALDLRLYVKETFRVVQQDLLNIMEAILGHAEGHVDVIMPGYTHMQRAQPVRLSHHLMAYFQMFRRDWDRLGDSLRRSDEMPLGAAALAGTTFKIERSYVASILGFASVSSNSMDAVSDRDFAVEFIFDACMVMMHLSRLAEELIVWSTSEFAFCTLPDEFCSGSSIMPQKKNPDTCELVRGKTGRVYGDLVSLLTTLKGLPLCYNKDLQEDKEPVFDAFETVHGSLSVMAAMLAGVKFDKHRMMEAASDPSMAATDLAEGLVKNGVSFRDAHARVGKMIRQGVIQGGETGKGYLDLPTPEEMVEARKHVGGTARSSVNSQIREARAFLAGHRSECAKLPRKKSEK